jgi:Fur family ferric uptake transcriptional regulator
MKSAETIFRQYLKENGLLYSKQREQILGTFMKAESHLAIDDIYNAVRKKNPRIGLATVYRTMKIICDCGLAREVDFGDSLRRFEHKYQRRHHHHLVCIKCGRIIEVRSNRIEGLQKKLAKQHDFTSTRDTMKIFGVCSKCQRNAKHFR